MSYSLQIHNLKGKKMYFLQFLHYPRVKIESFSLENPYLKNLTTCLCKLTYANLLYITLHFIPEKINFLYSQTLPDKSKLYTCSRKKNKINNKFPSSKQYSIYHVNNTGRKQPENAV